MVAVPFDDAGGCAAGAFDDADPEWVYRPAGARNGGSEVAVEEGVEDFEGLCEFEGALLEAGADVSGSLFAG